MVYSFIFDVDGTLFHTEDVAIPAFRTTFERLNQNGTYTGDAVSDKQITAVFGMTTRHCAKLYIASNDSIPYITSVVKATKMGKYFEGIYTAGENKTISKAQLVKLILQGNDNKRFIMVGDRRSDVDAGKAHGLFVIGCAFGYARPGELEEVDLLIHDYSEIRTWYDVAMSIPDDYNNNKGQQ